MQTPLNCYVDFVFFVSIILNKVHIPSVLNLLEKHKRCTLVMFVIVYICKRNVPYEMTFLALVVLFVITISQDINTNFIQSLRCFEFYKKLSLPIFSEFYVKVLLSLSLQ